MGKSRFDAISSALHCQDDVPYTPVSSTTKSVAGAKYSHVDIPKIGSLLQLFQDACLLRTGYCLPVELALDEMMIRFQGSSFRIFRRQAKPTSMGMKIVALTDYQGYLICFLLTPGPTRG